MSSQLTTVYLARHGETAWTLSKQHTGRTDLPLTENGEKNALKLKDRLSKINFAKVYSSPLQRAKKTCDLAGYADVAIVDPDLYEWDYGGYEGLKTVEIREKQKGWDLFKHGVPNGESAEDVGKRADSMIAKIRQTPGNVLCFSSAHFLRVFVARWLGMPPTGGQYFVLGTATISILGFEHNHADEPVVMLWNDGSHIG